MMMLGMAVTKVTLETLSDSKNCDRFIRSLRIGVRWHTEPYSTNRATQPVVSGYSSMYRNPVTVVARNGSDFKMWRTSMFIPLSICLSFISAFGFGSSALTRPEIVQHGQLLGLGVEQLAAAGCSASDVAIALAELETRSAEIENLRNLDVAVDEAIGGVGAALVDTGNESAVASANQALEVAQQVASTARQAIVETVLTKLNSATAARLAAAVNNRSSGLPVEWTVLPWPQDELIRLQSASLAANAAARDGKPLALEAQRVLSNAESSSEVSAARTGLAGIATIHEAIQGWLSE